MIYKNDTIVALATPVGVSSVAMIRVSGPCAVSNVEKIFKGKTPPSSLKGYTMAQGMIIDPVLKEEIDQVVIGIFKAPKSFTGEDVVEITGHGGFVLPQKILELLIKNGCRLAEPGEFSKRAFLNEKLDLSQAESLHDIITLPTLAGSQLALANLKKDFFHSFLPLKENILSLLSKAEAQLDYPEEEMQTLTDSDNLLFNKVLNQIQDFIQGGEQARKLALGYKVVLIGKTNVGKSSLLNFLAGQEKAIVSSIHGTTRDRIEVELNLLGLPVIVTDTAGIRLKADNEIEEYGILKSQESLKEADFILWVLDATTGLTQKDLDILKLLSHKPFLTLVNKSDVKTLNSQELDKVKNLNPLFISCKTGENIHLVKEAIKNHLQNINHQTSSFYINQRQHEVLIRIQDSLLEAEKTFLQEEHLELTAFFLRKALQGFSEIMGNDVQDDVLSYIFSHFCVGK